MKNTSLLFTFLLLVLTSFGQETNEEYTKRKKAEYTAKTEAEENLKIEQANGKDQAIEFYGNFTVGATLGEFTDVLTQDVGFGANFGLLINTSKKNNYFQAGFDIGYLYMGKSKTQIDGTYLKTTADIIPLHLVFRIRPPSTRKVKPYLDLLGGTKIISARTKFDNTALASALGLEDSTIFASQEVAPLSYGIGIGATLKDINNFVNIDFGIRYLMGGSIDYISATEISKDVNGNYFYPNKSVGSTNMLLVYFGVNIYISNNKKG